MTGKTIAVGGSLESGAVEVPPRPPASVTGRRCSSGSTPRRRADAAPRLPRQSGPHAISTTPPARARNASSAKEIVRLLRPGTDKQARRLPIGGYEFQNATARGGLVQLRPNVIKTHVARILVELELRNRVQAVVLAYGSGLSSGRARPPVPPETSAGGTVD